MYGGPDICLAAVAFSLVLVLGNQTFLPLHNSNFLSFVLSGDVVHTYVILCLPLFPGRACGVKKMPLTPNTQSRSLVCVFY